MMSFYLSGGVEVLGFISPTEPTDEYPVIDPLYGIDGFRNVNTLSDLNLIPNLRRRAGMVVGIGGGTTYYKLNPGPWNGVITDWSVFQSGSGGGTFTGGTVTGNTVFTQGVTATTISATTYQNLPLDVYTTGGTYSNGTIIFTNNSGDTFNVTGLYTGQTSYVNSLTTGVGLSADTTTGDITIINTDPDQIVTLSGGTGILTGGTYPNFTIENTLPDQTVVLNNGSNINVTGTYPNFTVNVTGLTDSDRYVTGFTYQNNTFTISDNSGSTFNATINTVTGLTVNGVLSATTISGGTFYGDGSNLTGLSSGLNVGVTQITNGTSGRVLFQSGTTLQQNSNFFWDNTNSRLSIGQGSSPSARLDVRAQGSLSTDIVFRVRSSSDDRDLLSILGNGDIEVRTNRVSLSQSTRLSIGGSNTDSAPDSSGYVQNVVLGFNNTNSGLRSTVIGSANANSSSNTPSTTVGYGNSVGANGISIGHNNTYSGVVLGASNTGGSIGRGVIIGDSNVLSTPSGNPTTPVFLFGNGVSIPNSSAANNCVFLSAGNNSTVPFNTFKNDNLLIGSLTPWTANFDNNSRGVFYTRNGVAPTTLAIDTIGLYSADRGGTAGRASLHVRSEDGTINVLGDLSGIGTTSPGARLDVRAQGALSTDIAFRVRNSADSANIITTNGSGEVFIGSGIVGAGQGHVFNIRQGAATSIPFAYFDNNNHNFDVDRFCNVKLGFATINANSTHSIVLGLGSVPSSRNFQQTMASWTAISQGTNDSGFAQCGADTSGNNSVYTNYYGRNIVLGGSTQGTGTRKIVINNGVAPTTNLTDAYQQYSADIVAGNAAPHFRTENGSIVKLYQNTNTVAIDDVLVNVGLRASGGTNNFSNSISATTISATTFNLSGSQLDTLWTSYTPTWTASSSNPSIGDGTIEGYYKLIGKTCFVRGNIAMGSTTTFGSGEWYVGLPFPAKHADGILMTANLLDNGTAWYNATLNGARSGFNDKAPIQYQGGVGTALDVNAAQPFIWTNSDRFIWNGSYEIA